MSTGPTLTTGAAGPRLDRPDVGRFADRIRHDVALTRRGPGRLPRRLVVPVALMLVVGPLNRAALPDHAAAGPPRALTGSLGAPALLLVARLNVLLAVGNVAGLPVRHPTLLTLAVTRAVARRPRGGACLALVGRHRELPTTPSSTPGSVTVLAGSVSLGTDVADRRVRAARCRPPRPSSAQAIAQASTALPHSRHS